MSVLMPFSIKTIIAVSNLQRIERCAFVLAL